MTKKIIDKLIMRLNRLKSFYDLKAPKIIIKNELRLIKEAYEELFKEIDKK